MSVTQPIIPDRPEFGSVEDFIDTIRHTTPDLSGLYPATVGVFEGIARRTGMGYSDAEVVRHMANAVAAFKRLQRERLVSVHAALNPAPVHYLEPGSDGDDDDRMGCGQRFGDAVKTGSYTGVLAKVTCPGCRPVADEWSD